MLQGIASDCNDPRLLEAVCPTCGARGNFRRHGSYARCIVTANGDAPRETRVRVERVLCRSCRRTHALIPAGVVPRSPYTVGFRLAVASRRRGQPSTVSLVCAEFRISPRTYYRIRSHPAAFPASKGRYDLRT